MNSNATTIAEYLSGLPEDRRQALSTVRDAILEHLPEGYEEAMNWGMITYQVPLAAYPDTYNGQPLMLAALASQKHHMAIYLTTPYIIEGEEGRLRQAFEKAGKKLDMGKSCIRFKKLDDIVLDPILDTIARSDLGTFVEATRAAHAK